MCIQGRVGCHVLLQRLLCVVHMAAPDLPSSLLQEQGMMLGDFRFSILLNYWEYPNAVVTFDTYIIFEEHLGAMLFARKYLKI